MRILIISDVSYGILKYRAEAIKKYLPKESIDCVCANDPNCLANATTYDVIHFNYTGGVTENYDFIRRHHEKILLTICNERSLLQGVGVIQEQLEHLIKICDCTTVSKKISEMYRIKYIPNGIDEEVFYKYKRPIVGYAGFNDATKNADIIKQACNELGIEYRTCDYTNNTQIPKEKMQDFYNGLSVYVHASLSEGFNNTVIEALSCNIPVLMTMQGVYRELKGYVGYILPTVESIKESLKKFMGRSLIIEKFLWKNIVPEYKGAYDRVYAKGNHRNNGVEKV